MIKAGEVAVVKATKEKVFVLNLKNGEARDGFSGTFAEVRRPYATKENGIQYEIVDFFVEELTTTVEDMVAENLEYLEVQKIMQAKVKEQDSPVAPLLN